MTHIKSPLEIFTMALSLGLKSFGGPIRHIKIFRTRFVNQDKSLSSQEFDGLVALSSMMPGPSSSQIGIGIGQNLGGYWGAFAFWLGFTLPSFILMFLVSYLPDLSFLQSTFAIVTIKSLLIIIVGQAWLSMRKTYVKTPKNFLIFFASAIVFFALQNSILQILFLFLIGLIGFWTFSQEKSADLKQQYRVGKIGALTSLVALSLVALFFLVARVFEGVNIDLAAKMFQAGLLVFGGGHVVLPMLQNQFVAQNLISLPQFNLGYLCAQLMPGPLFTFAAFVGADWMGKPNGFIGAILATIMIFLPGSLLMIFGMHVWNKWSRNIRFHNSISAINAAVVGALFVGLIRIL